MSINTSKIVITAVLATGLSALIGSGAHAEAETHGALIYSDRAYVHAIHGAPNPAAERASVFPSIVYVNPGYGQAIYSYASTVVDQPVRFDVTYTDTAHGPAIHSYPGRAGKFRLKLQQAAVKSTPVIR